MEGDNNTHIVSALHYTFTILIGLTLATLTLMTSTIEHVTDVLAMPAVLAALPRQTLDAMTGNMLGDGCIRYPNLARDKGPSGNARYEMTMATSAFGYMTMLYNQVYAQYSSSGLKG
jgi:hypothetical protein